MLIRWHRPCILGPSLPCKTHGCLLILKFLVSLKAISWSAVIHGRSWSGYELFFELTWLCRLSQIQHVFALETFLTLPMTVKFGVLVSLNIHIAIMCSIHSWSRTRPNTRNHLCSLPWTIQILDSWHIIAILPNPLTIWVCRLLWSTRQVIRALGSCLVSKWVFKLLIFVVCTRPSIFENKQILVWDGIIFAHELSARRRLLSTHGRSRFKDDIAFSSSFLVFISCIMRFDVIELSICRFLSSSMSSTGHRSHGPSGLISTF